MNKCLYCILYILFGFTASLSALDVDQSNQITEQSLGLTGVRITTFNMKQTINFTIKYRMESQEKMLHSSELQDLVISFFNNYEGQRDFWEIINKKLIYYVFENYPFLNFIESEIQVLPGRTFPYIRSSVAKLEDGKITDAFIFEYTPEIIQNTFPGASFQMNYAYIENIFPIEYLDFVDLKEEIDRFISSTDIDLQNWTTQKQLLMKHLIDIFPALSIIEVRIVN
jgi:hypothetical protein